MSVGVVGIIILLIAIITAASVIVVLLAVIARRQKAKECGTFELKAAVSVDKCSMWILVYCTVFYPVWRYFNSQDLIAVLNWYNFVENKYFEFKNSRGTNGTPQTRTTC